MQFTGGAHVSNVDGRDMGRITRLVINPETHKVTHMVVRRGMIFGEERIISTQTVWITPPAQVILYDDIGDLCNLPKFEEVQVVPDELSQYATAAPVPAVYLNAPRSNLAIDPFDRTDSASTADIKITRRNIPPRSVAVKANARVYSEDDRFVGTLESVLVDADTGNVTHIVISQGLVLKSHRRVPVLWCKGFTEDEVHIATDATSIRAMPEYAIS